MDNTNYTTATIWLVIMDIDYFYACIMLREIMLMDNFILNYDSDTLSVGLLIVEMRC